MKDFDAAERNGLTKRAAALATARMIAFGLSLLLPLILVRSLNQTTFGLYKQAFQILATAVALPGLGLSTSAFYFMPRRPDKNGQIAMNVLIFYFSVGLVVALLFAVYPGWVTLVFKSGDLKPYIPLLGMASLLWLISSFLETVTVAAADIRAAFIYSILTQITKVALLLFAVVLFRDVGSIVWAATIQGAGQCALLFFYLRRRFGKFWTSFDWALFKAQVSYAVPFGLSGLAATVQADLHNYFVSHYFDPAVFAIYSVGCFQLPLLTVLADSVGSVAVREVARLEMVRDYSGIVTLWVAAIRKMAFIFVPACTLLLIMRHEFIVTLFTKAYSTAAPIFAVNLVSIFLYMNLTGSVILAFEDLKYFRLGLYLSLIPLTAIALYAGIKSAGLIGAIIAVTGIRLLDVALNVAVLRRRMGLQLSEVKRLAPVLRIIAAAVVAALTALAIKAVLVEQAVLVQLVVCSVSFAMCYTGAVFAFSAITLEERIGIQQLVIRYYRLSSGRLGISSVAEG